MTQSSDFYTDKIFDSSSEVDSFQSTAVQSAYPKRFYAGYDPAIAEPSPVTGWYDMANFNSPKGLPPLSELLPLTKEFWESHLTSTQEPKAVQNGQIVTYTPPPLPLKDRAQSTLQRIMSQASALTAMGEVFGPETRQCAQKLRAIINGVDTTSTTLPSVPNDLTT